MANRFLVAGGTGNWNSTTNWAATSGGASGASFPVAGDVVAFDGGSGNANVTVNVASACASLVMSGGYAGTLTYDATLTLTSTYTQNATCTIAGSAGTLALNGAATVTSAGKTLPNVSFTSGVSYALADNLSWSGTLTLGFSSTFTGAGTLSGPGAVSTTNAVTLTFNNTGGLVTTGTYTLGNVNVTFAGSAGFDVGTLTTATLTASRTYTLKFGNTYRVRTAFSNAGTTAALRQAIKSGTPGSKVALTVDAGAALNLSYCDPTDVDSSAGGQVFSFGGVITTSLNWNSTVPPAGAVGACKIFSSSIIQGQGA